MYGLKYVFVFLIWAKVRNYLPREKERKEKYHFFNIYTRLHIFIGRS